MVTVKVTETYDMKTTIGKLGLVGIHTPSGTQIRKLYPGLVKSHKFIRLLGCDVVGACASVLPADPLQVGVEAGMVAPEDMFNPILYKACTNTSFDTLVSRIMDGNDVMSLGSIGEGALNANITADAQFNIYYSLLAENGEYRKVMPQNGFAIKKLRPICHTLVSTYGNLAPIKNVELMDNGSDLETVPQIADVSVVNDNLNSTAPSNVLEAMTFRGKSVAMPRLPIHLEAEAWDSIPLLYIPKTFVAALIVPPSKLHEFWYRVRVTWTIRFEEVCSTLTAGIGNVFNSQVGPVSYGRNYTYEDSKTAMDNTESSIDTNDMDITKVMEA